MILILKNKGGNSFEKETYTYSINYHYHKNYTSCNYEIKYFDNYNNYQNNL